MSILAFSANAFADPPVVGDPGSSTITITSEDAVIGAPFGIDPTTPQPPIGPVSIDDTGSFIWPEDDLNVQLAGTIADQEIASIPLTYDLSISNVTFQASFNALTDEIGVVNPVTQVIAVDVYGGTDGTVSATLSGHILGVQFTGTAECTWPTAITTLHLSSATQGGTPYNPTSGTFTMTDNSVTVSSTPSCNYVGLNQGMINLADQFILDQIGFPTTTGYLAVSGTISPAPQPATFGEITTPPVISGKMREGSLLSCVANSAGLPTPTVSYTWQRDDVNIANATASTHQVVAADAGHDLRCGATATNVVGSGGLQLSSERAVPPRCVVPRVAGRRMARARALIVAGHCRIGRVRHVASHLSRNVVAGTRPVTGTSHPAFQRLTVLLAR